MRTLVRSALLLALAPFLLPLVGSSAHAATGYTEQTYAARLLELFNGARQQHGLAPVALASGTVTVASGWAQHLADVQQLSHNPQLRSQLESHGSAQWQVYGENVGDADDQDPDGLFQAYMNSPEHRDNVLTPQFRYLGNAVVFAGGRAWNVMDLVDAYATRSATTPVRVSAPKPAPKPVLRPVTHAAPPVARRIVKPIALPHRVVVHERPMTVRAARFDGGVAAPTVQGTRVAAGLVPVPRFDLARVSSLAVAAMLAMFAAALWLGVALPKR